MKEIRRQNFIVVEGSVVVGSFVTLRDALAFRAKSGTIFARIMADHGEFDDARLPAAEPSLRVGGAVRGTTLTGGLC